MVSPLDFNTPRKKENVPQFITSEVAVLGQQAFASLQHGSSKSEVYLQHGTHHGRQQRRSLVATVFSFIRIYHPGRPRPRSRVTSSSAADDSGSIDALCFEIGGLCHWHWKHPGRFLRSTNLICIGATFVVEREKQRK